MSAEPVPPPDVRVLPVERLPGINALARGLAAKDGSVSEFLPDVPDLSVIAERARAVLASFRPRDASLAPAGLVDLAFGRRAGVFTGQQVGLFTGPLLTLTKALAAAGLAADLTRAGAPSLPCFWCASEDHDLVEVTRFALPGPAGPVDRGPAPEPLAANKRPVGALPIELDVAALLEEAASAAGRRDDDALAALAAASAGRTYLDAFRETLGWILGEDAFPATYDAARREDKPELAQLAARLVRERADVREILDERAARLLGAGHPLQVRADPAALPLFAVVEGERWLLRAEGSRLALKGHPQERTFETEEVVALFSDGRWLPSFSALSRPLAQSLLFPVAATILGPAEIAYWAQSLPLFAWAGLVPPVLVPRPMVAVVEPTARRAMEKLSITIEDLLEGPEAILEARGAASASGLMRRLEDVKKAALRGLDALEPELLAIDDSLGKALSATREKLDFALGKLEEKAASAAGRHQESLVEKVTRLTTALVPRGELAERVYTPVTYLMTLGRRGLLAAMRRGVSWERFGLTVVDG
jgi:bacillithiol biosynthesis cysteine-adding enzyme BshC